MREKQIEQKLVKAVKAEGEAPGQKPRAIQERRHEQLRELGFQVSVLDDPEQIPGIIKEVQDNG